MGLRLEEYNACAANAVCRFFSDGGRAAEAILAWALPILAVLAMSFVFYLFLVVANLAIGYALGRWWLRQKAA